MTLTPTGGLTVFTLFQRIRNALTRAAESAEATADALGDIARLAQECRDGLAARQPDAPAIVEGEKPQQNGHARRTAKASA